MQIRARLRRLAVVGTITTAAALGRDASAAESGARNDPEAALQAKGYVIELGGVASYVTPPIRGGTSPFGAGLGGRVGFDVDGFYAGAALVYFLGGSDVDVSYAALLYGVELGYDLRVAGFSGASFCIRPQVGVGNAAISFTDPSLAKVDVVTTASGSLSSRSSDTITVNNLYLRPGVTAMFSSGGHFVAVNANVLILPGITYGGADATTWLSYGLEGQLGFRF